LVRPHFLVAEGQAAQRLTLRKGLEHRQLVILDVQAD
jgi:hypothetical protein